MDFLKRLKNVQQGLSANKIDALFTTSLSNIYYLTGFRGDNAKMLISEKEILFFTDGRFKIEAEESLPEGVKGIVYNRDFWDFIKPYLNNFKHIGIEAYNLRYDEYLGLKNTIPQHAEITTTDHIIEKLRMIKEKKELEFIKKAQSIADDIFKEVLDIVLPDKMTEMELAAEMEYMMKMKGGEGYSFETIAATGAHSALPHARPRNVKIKEETNLLMDFGVYYNGYASDMTRTIYIGKNPSSRFVEVYNTVLQAQETAISKAKAGMMAKDIDRIARSYIDSEGYGSFFNHSLGHGVGIDVHEMPGVNPTNETLLQEGMVFTVEPGIYLKDEFGVRIEDMVYVKENGVDIIPESKKELIKLA